MFDAFAIAAGQLHVIASAASVQTILVILWRQSVRFHYLCPLIFWLPVSPGCHGICLPSSASSSLQIDTPTQHLITRFVSRNPSKVGLFSTAILCRSFPTVRPNSRLEASPDTEARSFRHPDFPAGLILGASDQSLIRCPSSSELPDTCLFCPVVFCSPSPGLFGVSDNHFAHL